VNQAARTVLLAIMPMLDDVDIAPVQRGHQSHGVVIPGLGGPSGAADGHGHGGAPVGGGPACSRSGAPAGGRGGAAGSSSAAALGKGKQTRIILDDDEVSFDEDEPLQKRLRQLSDAGPVVRDEAAAADKEAADKTVVEEVAAKRAAKESVTKEAAEERAAKEAAATAVAAEAAGAARGSPAPSQALSAAGAKRSTTPSGSTPPPKHPSVCPALSPFFAFFILLLPFLSRSSPSGTTAVTGAAATDVVVGAAPGSAPTSDPRTPEGVPEDVVESEGELEVAP
jgi:hypothetical protein